MKKSGIVKHLSCQYLLTGKIRRLLIPAGHFRYAEDSSGDRDSNHIVLDIPIFHRQHDFEIKINHFLVWVWKCRFFLMAVASHLRTSTSKHFWTYPTYILCRPSAFIRTAADSG